MVLWHINQCRSFNAKSSLNIDIYDLVRKYGISIIASYFISNPIYTYILNMICKHFVDNIFNWGSAHFFALVKWFQLLLYNTNNSNQYTSFRRQLHKNVESNIEQILAATPHKAPTIRSPTTYHKNYPSLTNQTCRTLLEKQGRARKWCTSVDPRIWPIKSRTTSSNIHTAAMWWYGM